MAGAFGAMLAQAPLAYAVHQYGWRDAMFSCGVAGVGIALLFYFLIQVPKPNAKPAHERLNFKLALSLSWQNSQLKWIACCAFLGWLPMSVVGAMWGIPYLMKVYHWPQVKVSSLCSLFWIGSAMGGVILSTYSEWTRRRKPVFLHSFALAIACGLIIVNAPSLPVSLVGTALFGLGVSVCIQTMSFVLVKENVEMAHFALGSGINNFISMMSGVLGSHIIGAFLVWQSPISIQYTVAHYQKALWILPITSLIGWLVCYKKIKETYCRNVRKPA